jgi:hypothetical protein
MPLWTKEEGRSDLSLELTLVEKGLFRKICGLKLAFEHCGVLESCPQRADSRMGLKLVGEAGCCGQLSLPSHVGLMNRRTQAKSLR